MYAGRDPRVCMTLGGQRRVGQETVVRAPPSAHPAATPGPPSVAHRPRPALGMSLDTDLGKGVVGPHWRLSGIS